jgi:phage-related protein
MAGFGGKIALQGETEYRAALKQITQNLALVSSEMKKVTAEYGRNDTSVEGLSKANDVLNKRLEEQKKKVSETEKMLAEARKEYRDNSEQVKKWEIALNNAEAEVIKTTKEIEKNAEAMKDAEKATDDETDALNDYSDEIEGAGQSSIKFGDLVKANVISEAIIGGFKALGSAVVDLSRKFMDFVKSGVENASNLDEVQNVVDTVFGESAKKVEEFSKTAATSFGMTELSVKQYAGSMGAMLDSMGIADDKTADMSLALVGLAGDMASFYNLDHDTAWEKIRSGISGETEPLKQLGINMSVANLEAFALSQGIEKAYSEMTAAEQATLRYNYLMETTANAQGDFAKTSDSYANQQRILSLQFENLATNIGQFLLPNLNNIIIAFNDMMSGEITLEQGIGQLTQIVVDLANSIVAQLPQLVSAGITMIQALLTGIIEMLPQLAPVATMLVTSLADLILQNLPMVLEAGIQTILALTNGIAAALPTLVPQIVDTVVTIAMTLLDNIDLIIDAGLNLIIGLGQGLINAIPQLVSRIPQIVSALLNSLISDFPKFMTMGVKILVELGKGLIQAIPQVVAQIPKIITGILNAFKGGISKMKEMGVNLLKGLWEGISSWASNLLSKIGNVAKSVVDKFKSVFGIHSPSTVFAEMGVMDAKGLGIGFEDEMKKVNADMADAVNTNYSLDASFDTPAGNYSGFAFETLVQAFKDALRGVSVVMDGDEMGEFVERTVTRVVYQT